jgi:catechol 2,3-dioxygenase-like lactoylglutathione lyase family enzyme
MSRAILTAAVPQLFVSDIKASCDFFTQKLGFIVVHLYGDPPFFGQVRRDGAALNLRHLDIPAFDSEVRKNEPDLLSAAITVDDVEQLYLEFQSAGVPFHQALRAEPWGARTFIVRDPDENLLLFAGSAE